MKQLSLDGTWSLSGSGNIAVPTIPAVVPGNIELDLLRAGIIPDPYFADNQKALRPFEFNDWCYEREFELTPDFPEECDLILEGVDCIAAVEVNGQRTGTCDNAFIPFRFALDHLLNRNGRNTIRIIIRSPILQAAAIPLEHHDHAQLRNYESLNIRKPAHSYGWDIAPRMLLGGLWRSVKIEERPANRILNCYFDTLRTTTESQAEIGFSYAFITNRTSWDTFTVEISGECENSRFRHSEKVWFNSGYFQFRIDSPRLWYPVGYGSQPIYRVTVRILSGEDELCSTVRNVGIRTVDLKIDDTPEHLNFQFIINGKEIFVRGANHVPMDALHSRDPERMPKILPMFEELHCNMIRVWGGGVYESDEFYDWCDRHGIMIWQDFMMACALLPLTDESIARVRRECENVIPRLRQHPSIVLWAGDNEVDAMTCWMHQNRRASANRLTRELLPQILARLDPNRPYIPSSPWCSIRNELLSSPHFPEEHAWGARDYFKSSYYKEHSAVFFSEIGWHGAPDVETIRGFLSPEKLWPPFDNPEWNSHASEGYSYRIKLMFAQIEEYFGFWPEDLETFVEASQFVQAEALKFFIETVRLKKPEKTGILWWNLIDCWPQFSDSIVDYNFRKKKAYHLIEHLQRPVLGMLTEWQEWGHQIIMTNDTNKVIDGTVSVTDAESGKIFVETPFKVSPEKNTIAASFRLPISSHRLLIIEWSCKEYSGKNHYLTGTPPFSLESIREWNKRELLPF